MGICEYQASDCQEIARLFYETIHNVNAKDYSEDQLDVWEPLDKNGDIWHQIISSTYMFIKTIKDKGLQQPYAKSLSLIQVLQHMPLSRPSLL